MSQNTAMLTSQENWVVQGLVNSPYFSGDNLHSQPNAEPDDVPGILVGAVAESVLGIETLMRAKSRRSHSDIHSLKRHRAPNGDIIVLQRNQALFTANGEPSELEKLYTDSVLLALTQIPEQPADIAYEYNATDIPQSVMKVVQERTRNQRDPLAVGAAMVLRCYNFWQQSNRLFLVCQIMLQDEIQVL